MSQTGLRRYPIPLAAAGSPGAIQDIRVQGGIFFVYDATGTFLASFDDGTTLLVERGIKLPIEYQTIRLENLSTSAQTVVLILGYGQIEDYRPQVRTAVATRSQWLFGGLVTANNVAANSQLVANAEPDRVEIVLYSLPANAQDVYLFSAAAANKHLGVARPGTVFRINYTGPVYVFSSIATDTALIWATYYV